MKHFDGGRILLLGSIIISICDAFLSWKGNVVFKASKSIAEKTLRSRVRVHMSGERVLIIGGGFGGLYTALKLNEDCPEMKITMVDPKDKFVFLPLLYELATDTASVLEVGPQYSSLLKGKGIDFVQDTVSSIDIEERSVVLSTSGEKIGYDQLVISVGAQPRLDLIPGSGEHAIPFYRIEDAYALKTKLRDLNARSDESSDFVRVAVVGGGYSGVEVACSAAEYIGKEKAIVSIIDRNPSVMTGSPAFNREAAERSLTSLGVSIITDTTVKEIREGSLLLEKRPKKESDSKGPVTESAVENTSLALDGNGDREAFALPADVIICTSGMTQTSLVSSLPLVKANAQGSSGRISVSRTLQCIGRPEIFALGDCACIDGPPLPTTAQVAMQQSSVVASNLIQRMKHGKIVAPTTSSSDQGVESEPPARSMKKFTYVPLGEMLTLGEKNAAISGLGDLVKIDGPLASLGRRLVYSYRMPTAEQQVTAVVASGVVTVSRAIQSLFRKP